MAIENTKTTISPLGVFLILLSLIGIGFFAWQIAENITEIDTKSVGKDMMSAAEDMSKLKSYSGSSVAEYFYRYQGGYLKGEAKIHNAEVRIQRRMSIGVDAIGILVCVILFAYGLNNKKPAKRHAAMTKLASTSKRLRQKPAEQGDDI